ncbi:MAG: ATP synthase subunit b, sodium ion specific [Alphaproteobacteria bacterium MarineAlpha2_Bin1]|nr:MAG: ATP synthase subunit b, sodium ion specific [Alphaproteobacteria bacterium MarineAlpha2_Bin1]
MPQLDIGTFIPQLVWLFLTFIVLYLIMSRAILPKIADVLEQRQDRIASDLEEAEKLKNEAQKVLKTYEREIEEAHISSNKIVEEGKLKISSDINSLNNEFELMLEKLTKEAEYSVQEIKDKTNLEIKEITTELVQKLTKVIINKSFDQKNIKIKIEEQLGKQVN